MNYFELIMNYVYLMALKTAGLQKRAFQYKAKIIPYLDLKMSQLDAAKKIASE